MDGAPCPPCAESQWTFGLQILLAVVCVAVGVCVSFYFDRVNQSQTVGPTQEGSIIFELLMSLCDGYLLLSADGSIASVDPGAEAIIGDSDSADGKAFRQHFTGDGLMPGQRRIRLPKFQVEVYTLQTPLTQSAAQAVLSGPMRKPEDRFQNLYLCCLRSHDTPEVKKKGFVPPAMSPDSATASSQVSTRQEDSRDLKAIFPLPPARGSAFRATDTASAVDGSLISATQTMVEAPNVVPQCLPNTWENVQAVGLGVHSYEKVRPVGHGSQGTVWQVKDPDCEDGFLAQKELSLKGQLWHRDFPRRLRDADREIRALKQLSWAKGVVVPIVDCWIQTNFENVYIVMEWLPCNFEMVLKEHRRDGLHISDQDLCRWLAHMACGIAAIHHAGFIHRDVKPSNILLDESRRSCKIADLGVSRTASAQQKSPPHQPQAAAAAAAAAARRAELDDSASMLSSCINGSILSQHAGSMISSYTARPGTSDYMSPEALRGGNYGLPMDIFGLGGVLLEMLTLKEVPAVSVNEEESKLPELCETWMTLDGLGQMVGLRCAGAGKVVVPAPMTDRRRELRRLCISMLRRLPDDRPSAKDVVGKGCLEDTIQVLCKEHPKMRDKLFGSSSRQGGSAQPHARKRR